MHFRFLESLTDLLIRNYTNKTNTFPILEYFVQELISCTLIYCCIVLESSIDSCLSWYPGYYIHKISLKKTHKSTKAQQPPQTRLKMFTCSFRVKRLLLGLGPMDLPHLWPLFASRALLSLSGSDFNFKPSFPAQ